MREKRTYDRRRLEAPVRYEALEKEFEGIAVDVSLGGMYVQAEAVPPIGTQLTVHCVFPGASEQVLLPATVRWIKPDGFGVQFGLLGARQTHAITRFLTAPA